MKKNQISTHYIDRNCPACRSGNTEEVFTEEIKTSSSINNSKCAWAWTHHEHLCNNCGHIFNANIPCEKDLQQYYSDQLDHAFEDYSIENRINLILFATNSPRGLKVLDYGSNKPLSFHKVALPSIGCDVFRQDIISDADNTFKKETQLPVLDLITSYFCLEHLTPRGLDAFFDFANISLKSDGKLIIEVPSTTEYFYDYSGLLYEHQQHFNPYSLKMLASRHSFDIKKISYQDCSRTFGFAAVLQRKSKQHGLDIVTMPRHSCIKSSFLGGKLKQRRADNYSKSFWEHILSKKHSEYVIWGINDYYINLKTVSKTPVIAVDSNQLKSGWIMPGDEYLFAKDFLQRLSEGAYKNAAIIVTATSHSEEISNMIFSNSSLIKTSIYIYSPIHGQNTTRMIKGTSNNLDSPSIGRH